MKSSPNCAMRSLRYWGKTFFCFPNFSVLEQAIISGAYLSSPNSRGSNEQEKRGNADPSWGHIYELCGALHAPSHRCEWLSDLILPLAEPLRNRGPCQLFAPPHWTGPVFTALGSSRFQNGLGAGTGFYLLCLRHALYHRCLNSVYPFGRALYGGGNRLGLDQ